MALVSQGCRWCKGKHGLEENESQFMGLTLMSDTYWLKKGGGAYSRVQLERPEKHQETEILYKSTSPIPLSTQVTEPEFVTKALTLPITLN